MRYAGAASRRPGVSASQRLSVYKTFMAIAPALTVAIET